jgi:hypothetical protein
MARGKQAAALFEVIHGKNRQKSAESKMATPKWWFKSRKRDVSVVAAPMIDSPRIEMPAQPRFSDAPAQISAAPRETDGNSGNLSAIKLVLPSSHTVAFGLMFAAVFGVGFITGQRFRLEPLPVISDESTTEIVAGVARPEVLDIDSASPLTPAHQHQHVGATVAPTVNAAFASPQVEPTVSLNGRTPSTTVVTDKQRIIGYNYVVIQSYPDPENAMAAVRKLAEHGVEATVIKGLPNWAGSKAWYSVVGTTGFDRIRNNPQYNLYMQSIMLVSDKFAGKSKFRKFEPSAYKWRGAEPANSN